MLSRPRNLNLLPIIFFVLLAVIVRLPFFFKDAFDWDESTFILMAQSVLDGNLPYTELWDVKPAGTFFIYALFLALFGKSILSIRLAGALWIGLTSFVIYFVGRRLANQRVGILAGVFTLLMCTFLPSGQSTMTEHIALLPLMGAFALLVTQTLTYQNFFWIGVLIAIATMVRQNLAYVTLILGCFLLVAKKPDADYSRFKATSIYSVGVISVLILITLPYLFTNNLKVFQQAMIIAPLSYANSQSSVLDNLQTHWQFIHFSLSNTQANFFALNLVFWLGGLGGMITSLMHWQNLSREKRWLLVCFYLFLSTTIISILKGGASHSHYLIQIAPLLALFAALFWDVLLSVRFDWLKIFLIALLFIVSLKPVINNYRLLGRNFRDKQQLFSGASYQIADYLRKENITGNSLYVMNDHLVLWLLQKKPIVKSVTHPSNISKDYILQSFQGKGASSKTEMTSILAKQPQFIVKKEEVWYLSSQPEAKFLLEQALENDYDLVQTIEGRLIYKRK